MVPVVPPADGNLLKILFYFRFRSIGDRCSSATEKPLYERTTISSADIPVD